MNKPHSFRKKPVIIEAVQYTCTADNLREITDWARNCNSQAVRIDTETRNRSAEHQEGFYYPVLKIETLEGVMQANVGDWIIKGVNGEFYPCKPDIFAKTYDAAEVGEAMNGQQIEQWIQAKGKTAARVTPADIEAEIASEHYFTAADGYRGRFATSKGLLAEPPPQNLSRLTFCVLVLRNGFTVTGESACASPENFDAEIGRKIARQNAIEKVWPLMGFRLRDQLSCQMQCTCGSNTACGQYPAR